MNKIKLPLRVIDTKAPVEFPVMMLTKDNKQICNFVDLETAQLFTDCFTLIYVTEISRKAGEWTIPIDMPLDCAGSVVSILKRAAEAVDG